MIVTWIMRVFLLNTISIVLTAFYNLLFFSISHSMLFYLSVTLSLSISIFICWRMTCWHTDEISILSAHLMTPISLTNIFVGRKKVTVEVFLYMANQCGFFSRSLRLSTLPLMEQHTPMPPASDMGMCVSLFFFIFLLCRVLLFLSSHSLLQFIFSIVLSFYDGLNRDLFMHVLSTPSVAIKPPYLSFNQSFLLWMYEWLCFLLPACLPACLTLSI